MHNSQGFSLIELLIAVVLTLAVGMTLFHLFQNNERVIRDQTSVMEMQQTARVVASQLADEIRMAGQEIPVYSANWDTTMSEVVAGILPTSTTARVDFRAGLSSTHSAVTGASPVDLTLSATYTLTVSDGSAFSTALGTASPSGKFVYIWGPTSSSTWAWVRAHLISITSSSLVISPQQSSNMKATIHFVGLPIVSLEEAVSIYLSGDSIRRATATDTSDPASLIWSPANEIGKNFTSLIFTYYDKNDSVIAPSSLAARNSIARVDIRLAVQTASPLSNGTRPKYTLALRTIPRNLTLRSAN